MKKILFILLACIGPMACSHAEEFQIDYLAKIREINQQDAKLQKELSELQSKAVTIQQQLLINLGAKNQLEVLDQEQENRKVKK